MQITKESWEKILSKLKQKKNMTDVSYDTWLKPLSVFKTEGNTITILTPSVKLDYIKNFYGPVIKEAMDSYTKEACSIEFISDEEGANETEGGFSFSDSSYTDSVAGLNPRYTFDTFVVGNNNKFAHAASLAVAESPGNVYNPLFLYGGVGLGKTHLMHSIAHFIIKTHPSINILYVTSEQFTNEVIDAIRNGNSSALSKFREKYRNIDVLLIDDIQFIIGKESTQEEFFHTFNALHTAGKQIIISSDRPPKDMNILEERIRSRFEWGLMADIQSPDFETRIAILQKKQELDGLYVNKDVIEYIAENVKSNIRELEGSLNKVIAVANLEKCEADINLAKKALKDIITPAEKKVITPDMIINEVASYFKITSDDILGNKRSGKIVYPRQVAMYLIREMTNTKLKGIGDLIGGKDHTTVMYSVQKIEDSVKTDPVVEADINNIKNALMA